MEATNFVVMPVMGITALTCLAAAGVAYGRRRLAGLREPALWTAFAAVFVVFVAMKANRVTELLESAGRQQAVAGGMYSQRHMYQLVVVLGVALVSVLLTMWLSKHVIKRWTRYRWTVIGTGIIVCFGVIRMVSLHEIDALGDTLMVVKGAVETAASVMAAWGAVRRMRELKVETAGRRRAQVRPA